ncbi:hypothetical protein H4684_002822 [Desulfomicrobium macestii]|uniref:Fibronectin type-III domain-containing protein n=1 Tax=Desulfomicrobium macestii TaxID=90731 RepID=A0ABR9H614_9BACT|nr:fibronectin type III domain-containing protein [Desulfomicrobium macestii]MBE1426160.1 hypothetical protein [Desulfomicrobium macestii]
MSTTRHAFRFSLTLWVLAAMLVLTLAPPAGAAAKSGAGVLLAASDGKGEIRFLWAPPAGYWPAGGWRLLDQNGKTLADIAPLSPEHMSALDAQEAQLVRAIVQGLTTAGSQEEFANLRPVLGMQAMSSWARARALGVAHALPGLPKGKRTYSVVGLSASGAPSKTRLDCAPVDAGAATAPLPPPGGLRAEAHPQGAALFWNAPPVSPEIPVIAYSVERAENDGPPAPASPEAIILGQNWNSGEPAFIDELAQVGLNLTYTVRCLDAFGRTSPPVTAGLFMDDIQALLPPPQFTATARPGKVTLAWKAGDNPNIVGLAVERATSQNGLYTLLTPQALDPKTTTWTDTDVVDSIIYHYRVRSVSPTGEMGPPSGVATAMPPTATAPPAPQKVQARTSPIETQLTWDRAKFPIAGYIVERRAEGSAQWARLNPSITSDRHYRDQYITGTFGVYHYRIRAVSFDNKISPPSAEVRAAIEDTSKPPTPLITAIDGADGKVVLSFAPGVPEKKTATLSILRGKEGLRQGDVLAESLSADQHSFVDVAVEPGQSYWYAVLARDNAGRESELSGKRLVTVGVPAIPVPAAPSAEFVQDPFAHVLIRFTPPPASFLLTVQRRDSGDGPWRTIAKGVSDTDQAMDTNPSAGPASYRIIHHTATGMEGEPSPAITVTR